MNGQLALVRKAISLSNISSLSVEQSKLTQQSTIKLGLNAICVNVSNMSSLVSLGTGGSMLSGRGVLGVGVVVPFAIPFVLAGPVSDDTPGSRVAVAPIAGEPGRDAATGAFS